MTIALFSFLAVLEIVTGAGVLANADGPVREMLGTTLIGFGILSLGIAGLQSEVRSVRREAAEDRTAAVQERQARAAADLKRRSETISSIDREHSKAKHAKPHVGAGAASYVRNSDSIADRPPPQPRSRLPQLRSPSWERRLELLASSASVNAYRSELQSGNAPGGRSRKPDHVTPQSGLAKLSNRVVSEGTRFRRQRHET